MIQAWLGSPGGCNLERELIRWGVGVNSHERAPPLKHPALTTRDTGPRSGGFQGGLLVTRAPRTHSLSWPLLQAPAEPVCRYFGQGPCLDGKCKCQPRFLLCAITSKSVRDGGLSQKGEPSKEGRGPCGASRRSQQRVQGWGSGQG